MKIFECEQGSLEWIELRNGVPTASQFDRIITPKSRKPSTGRFTYRAELVAEYLMGQPLDWGTSLWVERGTELEDEARRYYAFQNDVEVRQVGFIARDDDLVGCSPDGLIGDAGGLEIKCLGAAKHVRHLLGEDLDYIGQIQGNLWLTGREWWDVLSYNPELPPVTHRIEPDKEWQDAFVPILEEFIIKLEADKAKLAHHRVPRPWHTEDPDEAPAGSLEEAYERAQTVAGHLAEIDQLTMSESDEVELHFHDENLEGLVDLTAELEKKLEAIGESGEPEPDLFEGGD